MSDQNRLSQRIEKAGFLPARIRKLVITRAFGGQVRFARTAGIKFDQLEPGRAVVFLSDARKVQNHIRTVHAAAMALLAESATGAVFAMDVPGTHIPLLKAMQVTYTKQAKGGLRAIATLSETTRERMHNEERGEVDVPVSVSDVSGDEPLQAQLTWAWVPRKS